MAVSRGELWIARSNQKEPLKADQRILCLVISDDLANQGPSGLVTIIPLSDRHNGMNTHVEVPPNKGTGLTQVAFAKCDNVRSIQIECLESLVGRTPGDVMTKVSLNLSVLLGL